MYIQYTRGLCELQQTKEFDGLQLPPKKLHVECNNIRANIGHVQSLLGGLKNCMNHTNDGHDGNEADQKVQISRIIKLAGIKLNTRIVAWCHISMKPAPFHSLVEYNAFEMNMCDS